MEILTSVDACLYTAHAGLNETFSLTTLNGKDVSSLTYEVLDLEFLAARERSNKKRRLMLTPDFTQYATTVKIRANNKGVVKPLFYDGLKLYNSVGGERQNNIRGPDGRAQPPKEEEKSFISKYWMYLLMGYFLLSRLGGPEPQQGQAQGGQAPQRQ